MVDLPSHGVSVALLQGQLLTDEISRSAFLDRTSPRGAGTSEAAAIADKVLAIAAHQAARQTDLISSSDYIVVRSGAAGSVVARRPTTPTITDRIRHRYVRWDVWQVVGGPNNAVPWFAPNVPAANTNGML